MEAENVGAGTNSFPAISMGGRVRCKKNQLDVFFCVCVYLSYMSPLCLFHPQNVRPNFGRHVFSDLKDAGARMFPRWLR